jgi:hypothetical protein
MGLFLYQFQLALLFWQHRERPSGPFTYSAATEVPPQDSAV